MSSDRAAKMQQIVDTVYTYEMSNASYVNILKVTSVPFIKVAKDIKSVGRLPPLCASGGCTS